MAFIISCGCIQSSVVVVTVEVTVAFQSSGKVCRNCALMACLFVGKGADGLSVGEGD